MGGPQQNGSIFPPKNSARLDAMGKWTFGAVYSCPQKVAKLISAFTIPISGLHGDNLKERKNCAAWYKGPMLFETMDTFVMPDRSATAPFRIPMLEGYSTALN